MSRGGHREGAGRKSGLTALQALAVGAHCNLLLNQAAEDQAFDRYGREPTIKMIREEQERAALTPMAGRRMNPEITESIDDIAGGAPRVTIAVQRPYGVKAHIVAETIAWCQQEYGQIISKSKVAECLKTFRKFEKARSRSLIST